MIQGKKPFSRRLGQLLVEKLVNMSDSQLSESWRQKCEHFLVGSFTTKDVYAFLDEMSKVTDGSVGQFVKAVCDVKRFYIEPSAESGEALITFYESKGTDHAGRSLEYILSRDDAWFERTHDYVQWLFPNREMTASSTHAPPLTDEVVFQFRARTELRSEVKRSYERMKCFLQLDQARPFWAQRPGDHNCLRITRMLHCLREFRMDTEKHELYDRIHTIAGDANILGRSIAHWRYALGATPD